MRVIVLSSPSPNDDGLVQVRDTLGKVRQVRYDMRPKGTAPPAAGEMWQTVRTGETWHLDRMVGHPATPSVIGSRASAHPVLLSLLEALAKLGLVRDQTTP